MPSTGHAGSLDRSPAFRTAVPTLRCSRPRRAGRSSTAGRAGRSDGRTIQMYPQRGPAPAGWRRRAGGSVGVFPPMCAPYPRCTLRAVALSPSDQSSPRTRFREGPSAAADLSCGQRSAAVADRGSAPIPVTHPLVVAPRGHRHHAEDRRD